MTLSPLSPPASPSVDTLSDFEAKVFAAKNGNLLNYAKAVYDYDGEPYQLAWEHALRTRDHVVIICPPDTFKSTTVQLFIEQTIGLNHEERILWLMNAGAQAEKRVNTIASTIKGNRVYRAAFGVRPDYDSGWTKQALYVKRKHNWPDPTLMGVGLDGPYQGSHFNRIIIDDPTNQKDVRSPATMELQRSLLRGVIMDRLEPGGQIIAILTRWGEEDLVPTFKEIGFTVIQMPVLGNYPWGPTISSRRYPESGIPQLKRRSGPLFDLTYMCNPRGLSGGLISLDNLHYWDADSLPTTATLGLMVVDPAASKRAGSDPSCIAIGLLEPRTRKVYVTDIIRRRFTGPELEDFIYNRFSRVSGIVAVGVETIGYQMTLMQNLKRWHPDLPLMELPYRSRRQTTRSSRGLDRDKVNRALALQVKLNNGEILLPAWEGKARDNHTPLFEGVSIEDELISFQADMGHKHDEVMDVLAFLGALAETYSPAGAGGLLVRLRAGF